MRTPARALLAALLGLLLATAGCDWTAARYNRGHAAFGAEDLSSRPWLGEVMPDWQVQVQTAAKLPGAQELAGYPIGNGQVFGCVGLTYPLGTLENLMGPTYQKGTLAAGSVVPLLYAGKRPVAWQTQEVSWVRPGGIVRTDSVTGDGLRLTLYDFALAEEPGIARVMAVQNGSQQSVGGLALVQAFTAISGEIRDGEMHLGMGTPGLRCGFVGSRVRTLSPVALPFAAEQAPGKLLAKLPENGTGLACPLGTLQPGQSVVKVFYLLWTSAQHDETKTLGTRSRLAQDPLAALDQAHQYWQQRAEETTTVTTDNRRLNDFLALQRYLCQVQQATLGGFSPMHGYTKCWIRDSNGPVRYLLACGNFQAVRSYLDFQYRGYAAQGKVSNNLPLDAAVPVTVPKVDWAQAQVPAAEIASFMILQRYWYWQHTGDTLLIQQQWPMLRRCLLGQQVDERGTLPFFGDETYRFPGYHMWQAGKPAPLYVEMSQRSLDAAMQYVVAAEALAKMAYVAGRPEEVADYHARAQRVRTATEQLFWQADRGYYAPALSNLTYEPQRNPFAPINLTPLWCGYAPPDARQVQNLDRTLALLAKPSGTVMTTPEFGHYVPLTPGYLLYSLAVAGHPARDQALQGLLNAAEKSGGSAEMNTPEDKPSTEVWGMHRFRPWEGGLNAEAVFMALTGLQVDMRQRTVRLSPWLPEGCQTMTVAPLKMGQCRLRLEVTGSECRVTRERDKDSDTLSVLVRGMSAPVALAPGQAIKCTLPPVARGKLPTRQPFTWGAPEGRKPIVLVTWDPVTVQEQRAKSGDLLVVDSKLSWPTEYLRACLQGARELVLDVAGLAGAFKPGDYWTKGEGAQVLAEFRKAGGQVTELKTGRRAPDAGYVPDI